jgi:hypothetical protein
MARTKRRNPITTDPLMRKCHTHHAPRYEPTIDDELDEWLREQQDHQSLQALEDQQHGEEDYGI